MKDARFTIPTAGLLAKVVDMIDQVPMEERDTKAISAAAFFVFVIRLFALGRMAF